MFDEQINWFLVTEPFMAPEIQCPQPMRNL